MGKDFLFYKTLKAQETKAKLDKWDYTKLNSCCTVREVTE
jgi:hypothetical protein